MANANSMGGLCISFDTECRNSLSLKGLKRALDNTLIYDIEKELTEYKDIVEEFLDIICYNNSGKEIVVGGEDENTIVEYNDDWIVATTTLTNTSNGTFLVNIVNRKEVATYLDASIVDYSGNVYRYRGGVPFTSIGQLYCNTDDYNKEENKIGGFAQTSNLLTCGITEENLVNYLIELDLNTVIGKNDNGYSIYEKHTFFVPIAGNNKGKFYSTIEEAVAANS